MPYFNRHAHYLEFDMSEEYRVKTTGIKIGDLWQAIMKIASRIATKTIPIGASYADLVEQLQPGDFGPAPPPELRRVLVLDENYDLVSVELWPIDAENWPTSADTAEQQVIDDVTDLASSKQMLRRMARMIAHLYEQST